jgi:hypothetical protein
VKTIVILVRYRRTGTSRRREDGEADVQPQDEPVGKGHADDPRTHDVIEPSYRVKLRLC